MSLHPQSEFSLCSSLADSIKHLIFLLPAGNVSIWISPTIFFYSVSGSSIMISFSSLEAGVQQRGNRGELVLWLKGKWKFTRNVMRFCRSLEGYSTWGHKRVEYDLVIKQPTLSSHKEKGQLCSCLPFRLVFLPGMTTSSACLGLEGNGETSHGGEIFPSSGSGRKEGGTLFPGAWGKHRIEKAEL